MDGVVRSLWICAVVVTAALLVQTGCTGVNAVASSACDTPEECWSFKLEYHSATPAGPCNSDIEPCKNYQPENYKSVTVVFSNAHPQHAVLATLQPTIETWVGSKRVKVEDAAMPPRTIQIDAGKRDVACTFGAAYCCGQLEARCETKGGFKTEHFKRRGYRWVSGCFATGGKCI